MIPKVLQSIFPVLHTNSGSSVNHQKSKGDNMKNIYQAAREAAGMTQERASELIGLSVESIRNYETEKRIPADETVIKMAEIYGGANYLA